MTIGERIKLKREEMNLTQEELAHKLGYKSKSTINKIEMGINDITQSKVREFASVLNTTVSFLMGWEEENKPAFGGLNNEDLEIYNLISNLSPDKKEAVRLMLQVLLGKQ